MRELTKHGPGAWRRILRQYRWQEGMRGEEIQAAARRSINRAYAVGGKRLGAVVSEAFYAAGPAAAERKLAAGLKRRGQAARGRIGQPRGCGCR